jgi:hypothetical protein
MSKFELVACSSFSRAHFEGCHFEPFEFISAGVFETGLFNNTTIDVFIPSIRKAVRRTYSCPLATFAYFEILGTS